MTVMDMMGAHAGAVNNVFLPDERWLFTTAGMDGTGKLCNVRYMQRNDGAKVWQETAESKKRVLLAHDIVGLFQWGRSPHTGSHSRNKRAPSRPLPLLRSPLERLPVGHPNADSCGEGDGKGRRRGMEGVLRGGPRSTPATDHSVNGQPQGAKCHTGVPGPLLSVLSGDGTPLRRIFTLPRGCKFPSLLF